MCVCVCLRVSVSVCGACIGHRHVSECEACVFVQSARPPPHTQAPGEEGPRVGALACCWLRDTEARSTSWKPIKQTSTQICGVGDAVTETRFCP